MNLNTTIKLIALQGIFLFSSLQGFSQIAVTTNQPIVDYVNDHLLGQGVVVSNITFTGNNAQIGYFNGSSAGFGFLDGTVISSGGVTNLEPGNFGTDDFNTTSNPDLVAVAQSVTTNPGADLIDQSFDVGILEFDFVPQSNLVSFDFIFGSDEYETFINSQYNDAFGFFVSGPGITGPYSSPAGFPNGSVNLALVPGTNLPITISTIYPPNANSAYPVNPSGLNPQYYVDNSNGTSIQLNGYTIPINVTFDVQCGETYHFKFAVADMQDQSLSTAVFLEKGSFSSPPVNLTLSNVTGTNTIVEACSQARFVLDRSLCQTLTDLSIDYTTSGTATYGTDYTIAQPSPLNFPAGEDTLYLDFTTISDALIEGTESITLNISYTDQFGNPQSSSVTISLSDITPLGINETDLTLYCFNDSIVLNAVGTGGSGIYSYDWTLSSSDSTQDVVSILQNGTYAYPLTITDACLGTYTDTVNVTMNQTLAIDTMESIATLSCQNTGVVIGAGEGATGQPLFHWEGPGQGGPYQIDASVLQNLPSGWYIFSIEDNVCQVMDSIFVEMEEPPVAAFTTSVTSGCSPLAVTINNTSQNAVNYSWDFGNGSTLNTTNLSNPINQSYPDDGVITLIASKGPCADTTEVAITISICGCTSPEALNYNPLATVDDGSCFFPEPTVEVPNVFTPNGDGSNDVFELKTTYATKVEIKIVDRWGITMYEGVDAKAFWDGQGANDGVYFFTYTVTGMAGKELKGHGFVQLFR